jgi:hypothetical protein
MYITFGSRRAVQQLPENGSGELQYRVRSDIEISDRIVSENQLASRPVEKAA